MSELGHVTGLCGDGHSLPAFGDEDLGHEPLNGGDRVAKRPHLASQPGGGGLKMSGLHPILRARRTCAGIHR